MPEKHRLKKGGDANRKTARALLDFKDGLTAGEIKMLLAVATGASLAAIPGRQFVEKFPDLAAVLGMGRGARPQRAAGLRRNARRPSRVGERPGAAGRAHGGPSGGGDPLGREGG